ncbi:MAG: adenylyl-sulfate kinase [Thermodesulfobacteriota bacterium]
MKWHSGKTIWFTGLSGSGKSTLSSTLKTILESRRIPVVLLDGDVLRGGLNRDLSFTAMDRAENIRRAGEVAKILSDAGHTVIAAFITPYESLRQAVRGLFEPSRYVEIYLDCSVEVCESRDPKGLYCRARAGEIPEFTGVSAPFEPPGSPDLIVPTGAQTVEESLAKVLSYLESRFVDLTCRSYASIGHGPTGRPTRVAVIGLDGVPPAMIFDRAGADLHTLCRLMEHGIWGPLRSTDPPITVPAWTSMTTGKDPGELGLYGFRNRQDHDYRGLVTANAAQVKASRVWDYLDEADKTSILLGIPQTYPPRPHRGITISGFLAPELHGPSTFPEEIAVELQEITGGRYRTDVEGFRTKERSRLLEDLYSMLDARFQAAGHLLIHKPWDFFMMVEMATDRLHHAFWKDSNPEHPLFRAGNPYEHAIRDFYAYLDKRLGSLLALLDDDTTVLVVSDHGTRNNVGGVLINQWLMNNGFLVLKNPPGKETNLKPEMVDWERTRAWSDGGYYARIFLNVRGREPSGVVDLADYEAVRTELAELLQTIPDEKGRPMANRVLRPEELYQACNNVPPDLIVYFDDLNRRSIGTVGAEQFSVALDADTPDGANHDPAGIFICTRMAELRRGIRKDRRVEGASVLDITPTILHEFGLTAPEDLCGRDLMADRPAPERRQTSHCEMRPAAREYPSGYTSEEEELIKKRLADLGYI